MTQSDQDGSPPENTPEQPQPVASNDQTIWAVLIHLSGFAGLFFFGLQMYCAARAVARHTAESGDGELPR